MTQFRSLFICLLLVFIAMPSLADEIVSLKVGYQSLTPSGTIAGNKYGLGTHVDIEKDADLDDSEDLTAEVALQLGIARLSFGYLPIEFSGTGRLTVNGKFNNQSFSIGDTLKSKIKLDLYDVGLSFNLINLDDTPVRFQLGPEIAVKIVDAETDFEVTTAGINEHDTATVAFPTLGARARVGLSDYVAIVARAGYMEYDGNNFLDAEAQIEFSPLPLVGVYAGYRGFALKIDESDLLVDVDFSGPFVGAMVRF